MNPILLFTPINPLFTAWQRRWADRHIGTRIVTKLSTLLAMSLLSYLHPPVPCPQLGSAAGLIGLALGSVTDAAATYY